MTHANWERYLMYLWNWKYRASIPALVQIGDIYVSTRYIVSTINLVSYYSYQGSEVNG
jgi:hypothetical protein